MSQDSVRREIAAKRAYADRLEARANDAAHPLDNPARRELLLQEAQRARHEAELEEARLGQSAGYTDGLQQPDPMA
jgi:hypothetical protein